MPTPIQSPFAKLAVAAAAALVVLGLFAVAVALFRGSGTNPGDIEPPPVVLDDLLAEVDPPAAAKDQAKPGTEKADAAKQPPGDGAKAKAEVKPRPKKEPASPRPRLVGRESRPKPRSGSRVVRTARVGDRGPRIRFESVKAIQGLLTGGDIHLILETGGVAGADPHRYLFHAQLGALPVPPGKFAEWREEGSLAALTPSPELSATLGIGSTSAYYVQVGAKLTRSITSALDQAQASRDRSVLVIRETGDVRVALARR